MFPWKYEETWKPFFISLHMKEHRFYGSLAYNVTILVPSSELFPFVSAYLVIIRIS